MTSLGVALDIAKLNRTILCYSETVYRFNGVWEGPNPLTPLISLFLFQLTVSMCVIHLVVFLLKPFNQPSFVAELLGGILLGPSVIGRFSGFRRLLFPNYSFRSLEPMAHFAIVFYAFLVGLKMDLRGVLRTGPKSVKVAVTGTIFPFTVGAGLYFLMGKPEPQERAGLLFWGAALTVTGFSVLTRVLDEHQIRHTDIGKTAMGAAFINDIVAWGFLALAFSVTGSTAIVPLPILGTVCLLTFCAKILRPMLRWIIRKTPEGQGYSEFYICSVLTGMFFCGVLADAVGTHPMIGAFMFGLVIPNEVLEATLVAKLEDFVMGILMPVYFVVCGQRTNVDALTDGTNWALVIFIIIVFCSVKVISAILVTFFSDIPMNEAIVIGILSNTKSVMVLLILESGQVQAALNTKTYSLMVVAVLVMTMIVTPAAIWFKPTNHALPYKRRTIQKAKPEEELRVLACIYNTRNVPSIINLLRTSNSSSKSPISVFALQLVELVGRAATMLVVHNARKVGPRNPSHIEAQADQIISAFDNYELRSDGVRTQTITARCAYTTMDCDISSIARDKRAVLILIPFHKQRTMGGEMEDINPSLRGVNEGVMESAPCSVGIIIDRGYAETRDTSQNIAVLFFGGPDDREALAYAWRMADGANVRLTVVRFIASSEAEALNSSEPTATFQVSLNVDLDQERLLDDEYLGRFRGATENENNINYYELVLNDEEEAIKAIKSMDENKHDLYIVGKGQGMSSPLTAGLADWCDCPELGPIGDLLVTSEFESNFSVLVMQQYVPSLKSREGSISSSESVNYGLAREHHHEDVGMRPSVSESEVFESFPSFGHEK
jgi:Kef-type K+ transport system membrane component KefB